MWGGGLRSVAWSSVESSVMARPRTMYVRVAVVGAHKAISPTNPVRSKLNHHSIDGNVVLTACVVSTMAKCVQSRELCTAELTATICCTCENG